MLRDYNTFKLDHTAQELIVVRSLADLIAALDLFPDALILGGGSNVLFVRDIHRAVIVINLKGIDLVSESDNEVIIKVAAGEGWHDLVMYALSQDWGGVENLSLIPGKCGAAPMQNIGAYGVEVGDVLVSVDCIDRQTKEEVTFTKEECALGYRESNFKSIWRDQYIITSITLKLTKSGHHQLNTSYGAIQSTLAEWGVVHPTIHDVSRAVIHIRQSKLPDPATLPNAGSFFKNPVIPLYQFESLKSKYANIPSYPVDDLHVKVPAGWLIDQCGWKGIMVGDVGVHQRQALVLVNHGVDHGGRIVTISKLIQASVLDRYGIRLSPEVNFITT